MTTTTRVLSPSNASTGDPSHAFSKQCLNCGQVGHVYRHCPSPLTSYGILLFRRRPAASNATTAAAGDAPPPPPPTIEYLMICRRHSFGYVEFVRVNFDLRDEPYIRQLMSEMTKDERAKLRVKPFRQLWTDLWQNTHTHPRYANEYTRAEKRFEILRQSSLYRRLDRTIGSEWDQPEWGFPKGKRNREETSLACALREMHEETGIAPSAREAYRVFMADVSAHRVVVRGRADADVDAADAADAADADPHLHAAEAAGLAAPAVEMFQGTDGRKYRHVYFIAEADASHPAIANVAVDPGDVLQTREVSELRWLTYEACLERIRSYNVAKRALLERVHPKVCAYAMEVGGVEREKKGWVDSARGAAPDTVAWPTGTIPTATATVTTTTVANGG